MLESSSPGDALAEWLRAELIHSAAYRGLGAAVLNGVPNDDSTLADWVAAHDWPVILVVGMRLGCINHALLSAEVIDQNG